MFGSSLITFNFHQKWIELHWLSCYAMSIIITWSLQRDCVYFNSVNNRSALQRKQSLIYTCTKPITGRPSVGGSHSASRDGRRWTEMNGREGVCWDCCEILAVSGPGPDGWDPAHERHILSIAWLIMKHSFFIFPQTVHLGYPLLSSSPLQDLAFKTMDKSSDLSYIALYHFNF